MFFGDPEISRAQISPDGKFIAFVKPFKGTRNVWVKRAEDPFDKAKPITADTSRPIPAYFWSRDGKYILFVQDKAGDENYLVYAVDPNASPASGQDVPAARNLTDAKGVRAEIYAVPRNDPDALYVEMGPGNVLSGLMGRLVKSARTFTCGTAAEVEKLLQMVAQ